MQQLVVEQQLAGSDFAVTSSRPHKSKQARMDKMSSVWDWLQGSGGGGASGAGAVASSSREQQQGQAPAAALLRSYHRHYVFVVLLVAHVVAALAEQPGGAGLDI